MPKNLLIVESPAKAKTIEKYLGKDFTVRASKGHVRDLAKGDDAVDVQNGFEPRYEVISDKKDVIKELKKLIKEYDQVWLGTDEDREGEAISWHLASVLGLDPAQTPRIVFNEITKTAIQRAIENPRKIDINLVDAQQARRILDRIVGFKLSPVLWKKVKAGLSAGRVQSVAVRLIVEREREIINFEAKSNFRITADFLTQKKGNLAATLDKRPDKAKDARAFLEGCKDATYTIEDLQTRPGKKSPSAPFMTSTLQQEASRKLGFSVSRTMRVAQMLYENGHITYMRTDGVNLSDQALGQAGEMIRREYGDEYHQQRTYKSRNKDAQEAHEAIRPTDFTITSVDGERDAVRLYDLIWKRTVASQMADARLEKTTVRIDISTQPDAKFKATGEVLKFDGFLRLYIEGRDDEDDESEASGVLPPLAVGEKLDLQQMIALEKYSRPPARYTEATLVKKLEELGIGRPSTYAPTISTIQKRHYVVLESRDGTARDLQEYVLEDKAVRAATKTEMAGAEKRKLFPSDLGMVVTDFLVKFFPSILDYGFTREVEEKFDHIASGNEQWRAMLSTFYEDFAPKVQHTLDNAEREAGDRELGIDPKSGRKVIARLGRYGPLVQLGSSDEEEKPRYSKLRAGQRLETMTLEDALELFKLPRVLGEYEDQPVKANIGRYGPYVQLDGLFASLEEEDDVYEIDLARGIELIEKKREADRKKNIKDFGDGVKILNGRWGPYIKYNKENVKIPKDITDPATLTREDVDRLYEEHQKRPKRGRGGRRKKS